MTTIRVLLKGFIRYEQGAVAPKQNGDPLFLFQNLSSYKINNQQGKVHENLSAGSSQWNNLNHSERAIGIGLQALIHSCNSKDITDMK